MVQHERNHGGRATPGLDEAVQAIASAQRGELIRPTDAAYALAHGLVAPADV